MTDKVIQVERNKYEKMWEFSQYRKIAPGEQIAEFAYECLGSPCDGSSNKPSMLDMGCGTGRGARWFQQKGFMVQGFDIAHNCLDPDVHIPLITGCLWSSVPQGMASDYIYCTDVLEHIPEDKVKKVLWNIIKLTNKRAFLTIAHYPDGCGKLLGDDIKLHHTVKKISWWLGAIADVLKEYEASLNVSFTILRAEPLGSGQSSFVVLERGS